MSAEITLYRVHVTQDEIDDLRSRLGQTRWPSQVPDVGWSRGVPDTHAKEIVDRWLAGYDWRVWEDRLNQYPQFTTEIDGHSIHFLQAATSVRSSPRIWGVWTRPAWSACM